MKFCLEVMQLTKKSLIVSESEMSLCKLLVAVKLHKVSREARFL